MNKLREILREIWGEEGGSICQNPARCESLLRDRCGDQRREIFWLAGALREGIVPELLSVRVGETVEERIERLSARLADDLDLRATAARWAVETWAYALKILSHLDRQIAGAGASDIAPRERDTGNPVDQVFECPRCGEGLGSDLGVHRCQKCGWISIVTEDGECTDHPGYIVWSCRKCGEDHQAQSAGVYKCFGTDSEIPKLVQFDGSEHNRSLPFDDEDLFCWISLVDDKGNTSQPSQIIEWECPKCEVIYQTDSPGEVACPSEGCLFQGGTVDAEGDFCPPLIEWECPNCQEICYAQHPGEVDCDDYLDCGWSVVIDDTGEVVDGIVEVYCPCCSCNLVFKAPGSVRCYRCAHDFTFDERGDVTKGGYPIKCEDCGYRGYSGCSEIGVNFVWYCPRCNSTNSNECPDDDPDAGETSDADTDS